MNQPRAAKGRRPRHDDVANVETAEPPNASHPLLRVQRSAGNHAVQRLVGDAPRLVQRQPARDDNAVVGEPVTFIEDQLKRQFLDPEDPRLAQRVRRLDTAIRLLTLSEAKQLSDRLRNRGDELTRNFQKLATPSRNRLLAVLRRALPVEIEGKTLGTLYLGGAVTAGTPLVARFEVVPTTEEGGAFSGYTDEGAAREVATRRLTIAVIVFDTRLGRHRVFETGVPINRDKRPYSVSVRETAPEFRLVDWINLEGPEIPAWSDRQPRIEKALALRRAFEKKYGQQRTSPGTAADVERTNDLAEVQKAYIDLFEEAVPFARGQFHASTELEVTDPSGTTRITTADPAKINVNALGWGMHGYTTVLDPAMESHVVPGAHPTASVAALVEEGSPIPYEAYIVLTPAALGIDPAFTAGVIHHELAHKEHSRRAIELVEQWQSENPYVSFSTWVEKEVKARRLSAVEAALAIEQAKRTPAGNPWKHSTEALSEVEAFTAGYHAGPPTGFIDDLGQMASMWIHAAPVVQELAIRKLDRYYRTMLDTAHRQALDQKIVELLVQAHNSSDQRLEFYVRLSALSAAAVHP